jgi:hypothetical protein
MHARHYLYYSAIIKILDSHWADVAAVRGDAHILQFLPAVYLDYLWVVQLGVGNHPDKEGSLMLQGFRRLLFHCLLESSSIID